MAISASEARSRLFPLIQQVNDDHLPVRISSKGGDAVLMSAADFDAWQETIYLLRSPANARRLMEAVERDRSGHGTVVKTMEELQDLAGEQCEASTSPRRMGRLVVLARRRPEDGDEDRPLDRRHPA